MNHYLRKELRKITTQGKNLPRLTKHYLSETDFVAEPPELLRTVMFCGFTGQLNVPLYRPLPVFLSVPISVPLVVT